MKERPILFNGEMVRSILDGRKTQTRRPVKFSDNVCRDWEISGARDAYGYGGKHKSENLHAFLVAGDMGYAEVPCPFGTAGDRLWVRETFNHYANTTHCESGRRYVGIYYKADYRMHLLPWDDRQTSPPVESWWNTGRNPWTPSIHMHRWASRITLDIKRVWVERVQEIDERGALSEGVSGSPHPSMGQVGLFMLLWDSIYAKKQGLAWADNPWVWCCEFTMVQP